MARKKYQAYTEEFRREAVKRSDKPGVTQAQVAEELGISAQQIANWKLINWGQIIIIGLGVGRMPI